MDKKNTFLGLACIIAGIGYMFWQGQQAETQRLEELKKAETIAAEQAEAMPADAAFEVSSSDETVDGVEDLRKLMVEEVETALPDAATLDLPVATEESTVMLANEFINATFTTRGGAIRRVEFLKTKRGGLDDYIFNEDGYSAALSLSLEASTGGMREFALDYQIESQTTNSITFALDAGGGLIIRRSYELASSGSEEEPYLIKHSTTFDNKSSAPIALRTIYFNLGTARGIAQDKRGQYMNVGYYASDDAEFIPISKLVGSPGMFLGIGASNPQDEVKVNGSIEWSAVKNQFFASVLSSDLTADSLVAYAVDPLEGSEGQSGITGIVGYPVGTVAPGDAKMMDFTYYVGPKEFKRLQALENMQDEIMQFGFLSFISKLLLSFMYAIHSVVPSWGWSIVIMTICIKTLFWPLTSKASRSQKRMAAIQGPMAEMKEKYKDNPQKIQQETLKLFKEHQVNPVAGCLPMLIQMPIFLGLFYMLRSASELRHERFLWVSDLSQPDTLTEIAGFPINILPIIMGVTMFLQMSMMPVSPTADPMQQKIFKFLPFIFLIFLYNFSSGLVLYWTCQNILTIIQQKIINSRPDEPLKPVVQAAATPATTKSKAKTGKPRGKAPKK